MLVPEGEVKEEMSRLGLEPRTPALKGRCSLSQAESDRSGLRPGCRSGNTTLIGTTPRDRGKWVQRTASLTSGSAWSRTVPTPNVEMSGRYHCT